MIDGVHVELRKWIIFIHSMKSTKKLKILSNYLLHNFSLSRLVPKWMMLIFHCLWITHLCWDYILNSRSFWIIKFNSNTYTSKSCWWFRIRWWEFTNKANFRSQRESTRIDWFLCFEEKIRFKNITHCMWFCLKKCKDMRFWLNNLKKI